MASPGYPLFVSIIGIPMNFRLVCKKSAMKTEYLSKIRVHGGVSKKSREADRIVLVGGGLPCERGHFKCVAHPPFSKEPAFKVSWVDDCLEERDLLDIRAYLLNPTPTFARTDFLERMCNGTYKPPVPSVFPDRNIDDANVVIDADVSRLGDSESDAVIMAACQRALASSTALEEQHSAHSSSQASILFCSPVVSPTRNTQNGGIPKISRTSGDPLNIRGNSQASSTPRLPVASLKPKSFVTRDETTDSTSSSEGDVLIEKRNSKKSPNRNTTARLCLPTLRESESVQKNLNPSTSKGQTTPQICLTTTKPGPKTATAPDSSSSSSESEPSPPKRPAAAKKAVQKQPNSSDSDLEFGPPPGAIVKQIGMRQNTRDPYTRQEEMAILRYILAGKKLTGTRSNVIWQAMDGKPGVERRTWQSLKNHFLKYMLPNLEKYAILSEEQMKKLRTVVSAQNQHRKK